MLVIVAPGQGAQTPGFLEPWLADPVFESRLNWLSAVAGLDLAHYGTEADADTIRDTAIAESQFSRLSNTGSASHGSRKPGVWAP